MNIKPLIIVALFLSGCASLNTQNKVDSIVEDKLHNKVIYPTNGDELPCDDFPLFKGKTMGDLYDFIAVDIFQAYNICYNKLEVNQKFINILKKDNNEKKINNK